MTMHNPRAIPRIRLIINPRAGHRKRKALLRLLETALQRHRVAYEICWTTHAGHGRELAADAIAKGFEFVGVVGGDGSVNEVATAFVEAAATQPNTRLIIIPAGSGNGLARALHIPLSPRKAIELIHRGQIRWIDAGVANDKYFFSNAGVGFDALIARRFAGHTLRGIFTYVWLTIASFQQYRAKNTPFALMAKAIRKELFLLPLLTATSLATLLK